MDERIAGTASVLRHTRETFGIAQLGLSDFLLGEPARKIAGLCVLVVFGRAVTNVLQNLRTYDKDRFNSWYEPIQAEMVSDPLLKHFYNIRSEILKEGSYGGAGFSAGMIFEGHMPDEVISSEFDYTTGQTTWEYVAADGSIQKMHPRLAEGGSITYTHFFASPPTHHLGKELEDPYVETMAKLYLAYLSRVVKRAEEEFTPSAS